MVRGPRIDRPHRRRLALTRHPEGQRLMLVASRRIGLLERYRVPYVVDPSTGEEHVVRIARADGQGAELLSVSEAVDTPAGPFVFDGAFLHAPVAETDAAAVAAGSTRAWAEETPIVDELGVTRSAVSRGADGSVLLPFDIDAPLDALREERYLLRRNRIRQVATRGYYRARGVIPRPLQMSLRRRYRAIQERSPFPAWPTETSLHRLEALILSLVQEIAGEPLPWIWHWPDDYRWALVLTHDVEHAAGYRMVEEMQAVEARHGLRSAWYFVPERDYAVDEALLAHLQNAGCEICLHGLRHDGRDMAARVFEKRLPAMKRYAEQWHSEGFRSPSTHRNPELLGELGVRHDSSWSDVATYEPEPGGSCYWLPYFIGDVVELPITFPQDHTLFELRGERTGERWAEKAAFLRKEGGMGVLLTHPDYLIAPERMALYEAFLGAQAQDTSAWHALPREVAAWWRRRSSSVPQRSESGWTVTGPAGSQARVRLGAPPLPRISPDSSGQISRSA
jgi:peptidoglycan/xylan/chitin deacetylase (PgdA/CDA1 family)